MKIPPLRRDHRTKSHAFETRLTISLLTYRTEIVYLFETRFTISYCSPIKRNQ
jgi:hypothetical protein